MSKKNNQIKTALYVTAIGIMIIVLWQFGFFNFVFSLKPYQFPTLDKIIKSFGDNVSVILKNTKYTLIETFSGLLIGTVLGVGIAVIATELKTFGKGILTITAALNAVPLVAMAPIMNNWFGMDIGSKIAVVSFFTTSIMSVNAYKGLTNLKPFSIDLMNSFAADKFKTFIYCRIPNSIPSILTGLKVASSAALATAICSEFFSSFAGIGFDLSTAIKQSKMPLAWAYILSSAICGIIMYIIIGLAEKKFTKWHDSQR